MRWASAEHESELLAHGLGGRTDLPVAPWLATYAAAIVVALSFFVATALWREARLGAGGVSVRPALWARLTRSRAAGASGAFLGCMLLSCFVLVAFLGPDDGGRGNPAPTWFYVWFWVGLVPLSLLLGPVWRWLNPLRGISAVLRVLRRTPARPLPSGHAHAVACACVTAFLWLELVYDRSASPRVVGWFVLGYCVLQVAGGVRHGPSWFARADAFEVYSSLIARLSPVGRFRDGSPVLRNPLRNLASAPTSPDASPFVLIVLGSTAFDGVSRQSWWSDIVSGTGRVAYLALGTAGLVASIGIVSGAYLLAMRRTRRWARSSTTSLRATFAPSLVPIVVGYTVAHYFSFALFQGQQGYLLASDPLGRGWDLLGTESATVDYGLLAPTSISLIQVAAIVLGHVIAVVAAHDRSLEVLTGRDTMRAQRPLVLVMIAYTCAGIVLLAGG